MNKNIKLLKLYSIGIIVLFIGNNIISSDENIKNNNDDFKITQAIAKEITDFECYGFIIPLPAGNDSTFETFLNTKSRNLINDLLRENLDIYWSAIDFSVYSMKINSNITDNNLFKKGDFIIPLSGNKYNDMLTTTIIYDYFYDCEINDDFLQVDVYIILETFEIDTYKLNEPKIAQHLGTPTRYSWPCFLQIADAGGFFSMEFLLDNETTDLNIFDYNVFMWPYKPHPARYYEMMKTLSNIEGSNTIREFVRNGGGYIGTCYGAIVASSGSLFPIPIISLRRAYNIYLSSIPFLDISISDTLMRPFLDTNNLYISTSEIVNMSHPLSFGLNSTIREFFNGAWFQFLGRKSFAVGLHQSLINSNDNDDVPSWLLKLVIDTPSWVVSHFGNGKIVQYSSHPEFINNISILFNTIEWDGDPYYGRRTLHNALFYVTSDNYNNISSSTSYNLSFIKTIGIKTVDLLIENVSSSILIDFKVRINALNDKISMLKLIADQSKELYIHQNEIILNDEVSRLIGYVSHFCVIFSDYYNKTLKTFDIFENIYPLLYKYDNLTYQKLNYLRNILSERLNNSEKIIMKTILIAKDLKEYLEKISPRQSNNIHNIAISRMSRSMLNTYEIGLKYIPQIYFETIKLVRSCWYHYEVKNALELF